MEISGYGENLQVCSFRPHDVHAQPVNPFRVIPGMTASSGSEVGLGVCYDVFKGKSHDLRLSPQHSC
jgi:hypothetical protein